MLTPHEFFLQTAALTFDDGPDGDGHTDAVLDALKAAGVKATFFVNANNYCDVTTAPCKATLARISAEGHTVADHTYNHPHLDTLTNAQIATEFSSVNADVGQAMTVSLPELTRCANMHFQNLTLGGFALVTVVFGADFWCYFAFPALTFYVCMTSAAMKCFI